MKQKELEKFIESCENLIEERSDIALKKAAKDSKYKEKYQEYSNLYEMLTNRLNNDDIEKFANSIYSLNDLEWNYIYLQGFIDGILLRENLYMWIL